jgi:glutathione-independent formaldehyde dehydrogenase
MGRVVEVGPAVEQVKAGDMVCVPFNIACGHCQNCERGLTNYCLVANPDPQIAGAAYGFADMGPWNGGQAQYLLVPWADFNCLRLPEGAEEKKNDYVMLADIFPTGYHATEMAGVGPGKTVAIYGGGPVGLMAAYSAMLKSASKVMMVDRHPDRLRLARQIGAIPIDDSASSPVDQVMEQTGGLGADCGCECVGYQAHDPEGHEHPNATLNNLVKSVRFTGSPQSSACTCRRIRVGPTNWPSTARSHSTTVCSGSRASGWDRPVPGQGLQPVPARPGARGPGQALVPGLPRASAGSGPRGLPALRRT